jgi:hypothetical protein
VFLFVGFLIGASAISDGRAASLPECIRNSQDADNIINSAPCGLYGIISTRQENGVGNASDVTVIHGSPADGRSKKGGTSNGVITVQVN